LGERGSEDDKVSTMVYTEQGEKKRKTEDKGSRANYGGTSTKEVLEVEEGVREGRTRKNASTKTLGSRNRTQEMVCTKERKSVLTL